MKYKDFLKSKMWLDFKNIYKKDKNAFKCFVCKIAENLDLHHYQYRKNLFDPTNIVVLCRKHHYQAHIKNGKYRLTTGLKAIKRLLVYR